MSFDPVVALIAANDATGEKHDRKDEEVVTFDDAGKVLRVVVDAV